MKLTFHRVGRGPVGLDLSDSWTNLTWVDGTKPGHSSFTAHLKLPLGSRMPVLPAEPTPPATSERADVERWSSEIKGMGPLGRPENRAPPPTSGDRFDPDTDEKGAWSRILAGAAAAARRERDATLREDTAQNWPEVDDWYVLEDELETLAFGRVVDISVSAHYSKDATYVAKVTIQGIGWFDFFRSMAVYVVSTRVTTTGQLFGIDTFLRDAFAVLAEQASARLGSALATYIDMMGEIVMPESLGGGVLRDWVAVAYDPRTAAQYAPGWVEEGLEFGSQLAHMGNNSFEAPVGQTMDTIFAPSRAWMEMFPVIANVGAATQSGDDGRGEKYNAALRGRLVVVYRTKPWRDRPLSEAIVGNKKAVAPLFETVTFRPENVTRLPAKLYRGVTFKWSAPARINACTIHATGYGSDLQALMSDGAGLPVKNDKSIRINSLRRHAVVWPFLATDGEASINMMQVRAVAAAFMQTHGNSHRFASGAGQMPYIGATEALEEEESSTRRRVAAVRPGTHFAFPLDGDDHVMYAYAVRNTNTVLRNPNGTIHGTTSIQFERGLFDYELDLASAPVHIEADPRADTPRNAAPRSTRRARGESGENAPAATIKGFYYKGELYPFYGNNVQWTGDTIWEPLDVPVVYRSGTTKSLILHCTNGTAGPEAVRAKFQRDGLSTHFIVGADGQIWQVLDAAVRGVHASVSGVNSASFAIDFVMPFSPSQGSSGWKTSREATGSLRIKEGKPVGSGSFMKVVDYGASAVSDPRWPVFTDHVVSMTVPESAPSPTTWLNSSGYVAHTNFRQLNFAQRIAGQAIIRGLKAVGLIAEAKWDSIPRRYRSPTVATELAEAGGVFTHTEVYPLHVDILGLNLKKEML